MKHEVFGMGVEGVNMKKKIPCAFVALMMVVVLAGCGRSPLMEDRGLDDDNNNYERESESDTKETLAEEQTTPSAETVRGEFDFTTKEGYSYHVSYDIMQPFSIDTTEGKPGEVGLRVDFKESIVKVKNTTPGKKAPGVYHICV
jgi:predicted small lipoprotein YifL